MRSSRSVAWMFGTLLVATLIWTAAAGAGDPPSLQRAKELFKARQYAEALKACNQAIAEDPASAESYRQRALCRQRLDDLRGALADLDRAVEIEPRNATNWSSRSSLKRQLKDTTGAWSDIERAAALAPDDAHILNNRGLLRSDRGDYRGAVDDYTRALRADPRMSAAYNNRGLAREKLGDLKGALADYTQAVEVNPRNADAFSNRAYWGTQRAPGRITRRPWPSSPATTSRRSSWPSSKEAAQAARARRQAARPPVRPRPGAFPRPARRSACPP